VHLILLIYIDFAGYRQPPQITKAPTPFSFAERKTPATKPQQLTPADIAAIAHDGGVKQVTTSNWESFTQVFAPLSTQHVHADTLL
jgi:hypothetical protein